MGFFSKLIDVNSSTKNSNNCKGCKYFKNDFMPSLINEDCETLIIKNYPSKNEIKGQKHLAGSGSSFLLNHLKTLNMTYSVLYLVHCQTNGTEPSKSVKDKCSSFFLQKEFTKFKKLKIILLMGKEPAAFFFPKAKYNKILGNFLHLNGIPTIILPEPSKCVNNETMKRIFNKSIKKSVDFLDGKLFKDKSYAIINTVEGLENVKEEILSSKIVAIDIETEEANFKERRTTPLQMKCFSIATGKNKGYGFYYEVPQTPSRVYRKAIRDFLEQILADKNIAKVFHNVKFEYEEFLKRGLKLRNYHDTMIMAQLLDENKPINLKYLASTYLDGYESLVFDFESTPISVLSQYNIEDSDLTLQLYELFYPQIESNEKLLFVYKNIMLKGVYPLLKMQLNGVKLNMEHIHKLSKELKEKIKEIDKKMVKEYPEIKGINVDSTKQLGEFMFNTLGLAPKGETKSGKPSLTKNDLKAYVEDGIPLASYILERRILFKQLSTYVDSLPKNIGTDGRINSRYSMTTAVTGRLASSNPNLQNIHRDKQIKRIFTADDGFFMLSSDFSQAELRIAASIANEKAMLKIYNEGGDIHKLTAAQVASIDISQVTKQQRQGAKAVNFGFIYEMSAIGFMVYAKSSYGVTFTQQEAINTKNAYFAAYPAIKVWHEKTKDFAIKNGFVVSPLGRIRHLPKVWSKDNGERNAALRQAINSPVQGTGSDFTVLTMIKAQQFIEKYNLQSKLILTVHDSIVFLTNKREASKLITFLNNVVANFQHQYSFLKCPMRLDHEIGPTYGDLQEVKSLDDIENLEI